MDRNYEDLIVALDAGTSLSARRAWIEISEIQRVKIHSYVALRKESVDRNVYVKVPKANNVDVALRKESVDRNLPGILGARRRKQSLSARRAWIEIRFPPPARFRFHRRSPQGERG